MPAPLAVDREQVRMLVIEHGVREAARMCNLSQNTVLAWSNRGGWLDHTRPEPPKLPQSMQPVVAIGAIKPADALANTLLEDGNATKLHAMRYAKNVTKHAAEISESDPDAALAAASDVKAGLQVAAIAGSWTAGAGGNSVSINLLIQ